jgi:uncharacterized membrane protein YqjE
MINGAGENAPPDSAEVETESGPARALSLHLLRMLETRMDAAGIALQGELQSFTERLQLKLLAAGALFLAIWGGIVLLAIALPPDLRIPVLGAVVVGFVLIAVWAQRAAARKGSGAEVGSLRWFLDSIKLDLDVLTRTLAQHRPQAASPPAEPRSTPNDLAA